MTLNDPFAPSARQRVPQRDAERLRRAMSRWRRRSLVIKFWRVALPVLIAVLSGGVLFIAVVNVLYGPGRVADQDQQVRMLAPRFLGRDKGGRPYTVTAREASRDPAHPNEVSLDRPHLVLETTDGSPPTVVDSAFGVYNEASHMLALDGQVVLDDGKHDIVRSEHALVDTDKGQAVGRSAVLAEGPQGTTAGDSYVVLDRGNDISFTGHVKSHLYNK